jgi:hypothetical protein
VVQHISITFYINVVVASYTDGCQPYSNGLFNQPFSYKFQSYDQQLKMLLSSSSYTLSTSFAWITYHTCVNIQV